MRLKVLSLFDGISCGQVALNRAGMTVEKYFAAEVDSKATSVAHKNFPETISLGDVKNWRDWHIPWGKIDLILAGSPCQGFSSAGEKRGFDDVRSSLFFVFLDILEYARLQNPQVHFLLENVNMKTQWLTFIDEAVGVGGVRINSSLVSAQLRERVYWTSWPIVPPEDSGKDLNDLVGPRWWSPNKKSYCIDANYFKSSNFKQFFFKCRRQMVFPKGYDPRHGLTEENANERMHEDGMMWRLLTCEEVEEMQGLPKSYTEGIPKTSRYHALGNGWTVGVVSSLFEQLENYEISLLV